MTYLDFNSGTPGTSISGWTLRSGTTFQYATGGLASFLSPADGQGAVYTSGPSQTDSATQVTTTIDFNSSSNYVIASPILNSDSALNNCYYCGFGGSSGTNAQVAFFKNVGGSYSLLALVGLSGISLANGQQYNIRFERVGSTLGVYVWLAGTSQPGSYSATATDSGTVLGAGYAGLRIGSPSTAGFTHVDVDDFYVGVPSDTFSPGGGVLTAGTASVTATGTTTATVTATAPTGGTSPYTPQWQRSLSSGSGYSNVSGATSLTLNDTGLTQGVTYYWRCVQTDAASATVTTNVVSATTKVNQLVVDGNSLDVAAPSAVPWSLTAKGILPATWAVNNVAVSGQTIADMVANASTNVVPLLLAGNTVNIVVCHEFANYFYFGGVASGAWSQLVAYSQLTRFVNRTVLLVGLPQPDRNDFPGSSTIAGTPTVQRATYQAEVNNFRAIFLPQWRTVCDGYIDVNNDVRFLTVTNGTYFQSDEIHWTTALQSIYAEKVVAAMPQTINPQNRVQWVG